MNLTFYLYRSYQVIVELHIFANGFKTDCEMDVNARLYTLFMSVLKGATNGIAGRRPCDYGAFLFLRFNYVITRHPHIACADRDRPRARSLTGARPRDELRLQKIGAAPPNTRLSSLLGPVDAWRRAFAILAP